MHRIDHLEKLFTLHCEIKEAIEAGYFIPPLVFQVSHSRLCADPFQDQILSSRDLFPREEGLPFEN